MTDHADLIRRLENPTLDMAPWREFHRDLAAVIKELVAERDEMHDALATAYLHGAKEWKDRAEKAEAGLAAARKALRYADEEKGISWIPEHAPTIAAARAEGGE